TVREQAAAHLDRLREVDADPSAAPVGDAPALRLEALAERDDGPVPVPLQDAPDLAVEREDAKGLPLRQPARAEALGERVVDAVDDFDRGRVVQHGVGTAGLERAVVERPE